MAFGLVIPTQAAHAATFNVGCGNVSGLISAMNAANTAGGTNTINLASNCTYTLTNFNNTGADGANGLPKVDNNLTINANRSTIRRSTAPSTPAFRILEVETSQQLTLNGATISNGLVDSSSTRGGGGIFNCFGTLRLNNTIVRDNTSAQGEAGGVLNFFAFATITGSQITHNHVTHASGDGTFGGGIYNDIGTLTVKDTEISSNTVTDLAPAQRAEGAGLGNTGKATLTNTAVVNNTATDNNTGSPAPSADGAGILNDGTGLVLNSSTVKGNLATAPHGKARGGGIDNEGGSAQLNNSAVQSNTAQSFLPPNGGGIYLDGGSVVLNSTTVTGNNPNNCEPSIPGC